MCDIFSTLDVKRVLHIFCRELISKFKGCKELYDILYHGVNERKRYIPIPNFHAIFRQTKSSFPLRFFQSKINLLIFVH